MIKRKSFLKPSSLPRRSAAKKKARSRAGFARIYGSKERVLFVKTLPCAACGVEGFSVNAHIAPPGEKGTGYKADAKWIAPLCFNRWEMPFTGARIEGCHPLYDEHRSQFNAKYPDFDPEKAAAETEVAWLAHTEEGK